MKNPSRYKRDGFFTNIDTYYASTSNGSIDT